jgi:hypothetical protein
MSTVANIDTSILSSFIHTFFLYQLFHAQGIILFHMDTVSFCTPVCPKLFHGASELLLARDSNNRCRSSVSMLQSFFWLVTYRKLVRTNTYPFFFLLWGSADWQFKVNKGRGVAPTPRQDHRYNAALQRLGRPRDNVTERQVLLCFSLDNCFSFSPRHTKPLPESVRQQVKYELFEGDLTDSEEEEKVAYPQCSSLYLIFLVSREIPRNVTGGVVRGV